MVTMSRQLSILVLVLLFLSGDLSVAGGKGSGGGTVTVRGHVRKDGTYVAPHHRTAPDGNFQNNWSTSGNYNPYTGEEGKVVAPPNRPLGASTSTYAVPLYAPVQPVTTPGVPPALPLPGSLAQPETAARESPSALFQPDALPSEALGIERVPPAFHSVAPHAAAPTRPLTYLEQQKQRDTERARFWERQGYSFNPAYMTAYSMDQKVKDIERARFWQSKGYSFNPEYMTAYSMDQKVKDIERARYWQERGYTFSPEYMTAYSMDQKVRDIERARYWSARGLHFDPNYMTAYSMDREAERRGTPSR